MRRPKLNFAQIWRRFWGKGLEEKEMTVQDWALGLNTGFAMVAFVAVAFWAVILIDKKLSRK